MLFDTPIFFLFLAVVIAVYWGLTKSGQNRLLLVASYIFYGWWDWRFLSLIFISTLVDYFSASFIYRSGDKLHRRSLLAVSVAMNLGFLGFFKYFNFFADSFSQAMHLIGISVPTRTLNVLLPPGISFYTFQALAYIVDVYFGRIRPAKSLVDYALFISFFPHLIAGPIQRPSHLLPQVQEPRQFDARRVWAGIMLIIFGMFQKCVVADNCSLLANAAFGGKLGAPNLAVLALGAYAFAWQIYGDFAGYSNIARGSAQLLGFHFMVNFRQPYLALSLKDFWRRWHISLSTWLRDYLYISLGGSRNGGIRTHRNLILTMLIGGLWHGANWTYVIWGAIHGVLLSIGRVIETSWGIPDSAARSYKRTLVSAWLQRIVVFHIVCLAWVCFRASTIGDAARFLRGAGTLEWIPQYRTAFVFLAIFALPMFAIDVFNELRGDEYPSERGSPHLQLAVALLVIAATVLLAGSTANAFIYFQF
jgi:alginate O-acetyltransferase complex protein AlgI